MASDFSVYVAFASLFKYACSSHGPRRRAEKSASCVFSTVLARNIADRMDRYVATFAHAYCPALAAPIQLCSGDLCAPS